MNTTIAPRFRDLLRPTDRIRYLAWRASGRVTPITLRMREGIRFRLRPPGPEHNDYGIFYEIFSMGCYRLPPAF